MGLTIEDWKRMGAEIVEAEPGDPLIVSRPLVLTLSHDERDALLGAMQTARFVVGRFIAQPHVRSGYREMSARHMDELRELERRIAMLSHS